MWALGALLLRNENKVIQRVLPTRKTRFLEADRFFSIFNSDAIKNVTLIKGGMPAQYGGRLSSVLDVSMKEGNNQKFQVDAGIGFIASRLSVQGPLKKNKSSFIISGRRTYVDAIAKPFLKRGSQFKGSGYYFYDLNAKVNYIFSDKDRLYLSGYFGRDVFDYVNGKQSLKFNIPWGNSTGTLRWNHVFNNNTYRYTTNRGTYNMYRYTTNSTLLIYFEMLTYVKLCLAMYFILVLFIAV